MNNQPNISLHHQQCPPPLTILHFNATIIKTMKKLPFYDVLHTLLKPSPINPQINQTHQEVTFHFYFTPEQATEIALSRNVGRKSAYEYSKHVQLRFCMIGTTAEQEDCFPPGLVVIVNNKLCSLPKFVLTNKLNTDPKRLPGPVNVTNLLKLSPTVANHIHISWAVPNLRNYAFAVDIVEKLTPTELLRRLKIRGINHPDNTRSLIKKKFDEDADSEIVTTSLRVSLLCPLGKIRMTTPCRSATCQHLQCFDAFLFLQMNECKPTWNCPVCNKPALFDSLLIDGYFEEVLASSTSKTKEIEVKEDGSWIIHTDQVKVLAKGEELPNDSLAMLINDIDDEDADRYEVIEIDDEDSSSSEESSDDDALKINIGDSDRLATDNE